MKEIFRKELYNFPTFINLKTLVIGPWCMVKNFDLVAAFLEHSPNLEELTLFHVTVLVIFFVLFGTLSLISCFCFLKIINKIKNIYIWAFCTTIVYIYFFFVLFTHKFLSLCFMKDVYILRPNWKSIVFLTQHILGFVHNQKELRSDQFGTG